MVSCASYLSLLHRKHVPPMDDRPCDPHLAHLVSWHGKRVAVQAHAIGHLPGRQHPPSAIPPQDLCRAHGIYLKRPAVNTPHPVMQSVRVVGWEKDTRTTATREEPREAGV